MTVNNVVDYKLDEHGDIFLDHRGDLAFVNGREAFEQEIRVRINENVDIFGDFESETIRDLAELQVGRVADEMDEIGRVASYSATLVDDTTLEVDVVFDTSTIDDDEDPATTITISQE